MKGHFVAKTAEQFLHEKMTAHAEHQEITILCEESNCLAYIEHLRQDGLLTGYQVQRVKSLEAGVPLFQLQFRNGESAFAVVVVSRKPDGFLKGKTSLVWLGQVEDMKELVPALAQAGIFYAF